jgi:hypothetical protein
VRIFRDASGAVRATVRGLRSVIRPAFVRAFPVTRPYGFIELREEAGDSVGMLKDLAGVAPASRVLIEELLRERYFVPAIRRIVSVRRRSGSWAWAVETDRGRREFVVKSVRDDVRRVLAASGDGAPAVRRIRVTDADGNVYEVPDEDALDAASRSQLAKAL